MEEPPTTYRKEYGSPLPYKHIIRVPYYPIKGEMSTNFTFYERIKLLASENRKSIRQIEDELQITHGNIKKWQKSTPSIDSVARIADYFKVSIDTLLGRDEARPISEDEKRLLDLFRSMSEQGKAFLMQSAEIASKTYIKSADVSEAVNVRS